MTDPRHGLPDYERVSTMTPPNRHSFHMLVCEETNTVTSNTGALLYRNLKREAS
jgi:hypothetical protein